MRITEFWARMEQQFGVAYADSYAKDQVIKELGSRTVCEALSAGDNVKAVWRAVCASANVPEGER